MKFNLDKLNSLLIIVSAVLAYFFPIELFLLAYAVLGPLHYVTEINWLHHKKYYFANNSWIWLSIGTLASILLFLPHFYLEYGNADSTLGAAMLTLGQWSNGALFICLLLAAAYQFVRSRIAWALVVLIGISGAILLKQFEYYNVLVGSLLPTLIHVYIFTLIFMLYGAQKSKSNAGYWSVTLALVVPLIYVLVPIIPDYFWFSDELIKIYGDNGFQYTSIRISQLIGFPEKDQFEVYESLELKLMMFVAFMYLYHYLNWFSKTTVIKWHKMLNKKRSIAVILIWVVSFCLYAIDYRLGFLSSLFLSFLHVILEFPLNMMSLKGLLVK